MPGIASSRWQASFSRAALRMLLAQLKLELDHLEMRIDEADAVIKKTRQVRLERRESGALTTPQ
jgi:hypothetical protein